MKMRLLATAALATLLGAGMASANDSGWYGGVEAGWHQAEDVKAVSDDFDTDWNFEFDSGLAAAAELGYRWNPNWRTELEFGYRHQDLGDITCCDTGDAAFADGVEGNLKVLSAMFNVIYDIMPNSNWTPFVGLGAGWAQAQANYAGFDGEGGDLDINDKASGFAYQALAGLAWHISDRTDLNLTYRYFVMDGIDLVGDYDGEGGSFAFDDYKDHSVMVGVRHAFGAAPAPVVAPPAPAPMPVPPPPPPAPKPAVVAQPMSFIVYFPFDQSILTPEANDILDKAAEYAKTNKGAKIMIVGHTDKSGSDGYNLRLSQKRAKVVVDGLAQRGIDTSMVGSDYKGESAPAVDTPDGTKEPLNRRSTIDITFAN